jgi:hypothetical protein
MSKILKECTIWESWVGEGASGKEGAVQLDVL